ncbi:hypothetical protein FS837_007059, partial [Tulasnella sp. UAMH 9824]
KTSSRSLFVSNAQPYGSSLTLTSNTTSSSAPNPYSHEKEGLGGNRLWYEQMKRIHHDITDLEGALVRENGVVKEDID